MHTRPHGTVTQHIQHTAPGVTAREPSAASVVEDRMPLSGGAISYTKAGTGPAVLLIHGLGGTRRTWRHLIPGLARTHTVIAPDLPGHGLSDLPAGDYSLGAHACAMRDLLLTLSYPRASIVGHSLGGGVALQTFLAATQPFRYVEDRFVRLLSSADPVEARRAAAGPVPGHASRPIIQ